MCLAFLDFAETIDYPVEGYMTSDNGFWDAFNDMKAEFGSSEGMSENFGYFKYKRSGWIYIIGKVVSGINLFKHDYRKQRFLIPPTPL